VFELSGDSPLIVGFEVIWRLAPLTWARSWG